MDYGWTWKPWREWMSEQGLGEGPLEDVSAVTGGTQNVMLRFTRSGRPYVLRRGPRHLRPRSNSVILRETRVLAALAGSDVPHPHLIATCDDPGVLGDAVFYLMEPVDGFNAGEGLPPLHAGDAEVRHGMGLSMADALAKLGAVDHVAVGLADFGKPDGFLERQVPRWLSELESYQRVRRLPGPRDPGHRGGVRPGWRRHRPTTWTPGIMHGDYHAANVMFSRTGPDVVAIVDWEMCTIGDPLLDLGWLLATWRQSDGSAVFSHALGAAGRVGQHRRTAAALCRQHHPRPVAHHLVHRAGLLQARHRDRGHAGPGLRGQGREGGRRPTPRGHGAPVRTGAQTDRERALGGHFGKPRLPRVDHRVEPVAGLQPLADLLDRAVGKRGDIEVLPDSLWRNRCRENRAAALNTPGQQHLCGSFSEALGKRDDQRVVEQSRLHACPSEAKASRMMPSDSHSSWSSHCG